MLRHSRFARFLWVLSTCSLIACSLPARSADSTSTDQNYAHEQQWIVGSIGQDVAEMVLFAAQQSGDKTVELDALKFQTTETAGKPNCLAYMLSWGKGGDSQVRDFALSEYAWSPSNFSPWATQLLKNFKLSPDTATPSASDQTIDTLSNYTEEVLARENKRLSLALTEHPLDPNLHEQAALLCAIFALRERLSCFADERPWLNRIAAHLSMAEALEQRSGRAGKLAQLVLLCLCGRPAEAVSRIETMEAENPPEVVKSYLRAIRMRATGDQRVAVQANAKTVELLEYGSALSRNLKADAITEYLEKNKPAGDPIEWLRIGYVGLSSVGAGHEYAEPGPTQELSDFARDYQLYASTPVKEKADYFAALNQRPTRCLIKGSAPHLEAISAPDISAFHSRRVLEAIFQKYVFEKTMWGVPEQAASTAEQADATFAPMRLFPLCKLSILSVLKEKAKVDLTEKLAALVRETPEDVNSLLWHRASECADPQVLFPAMQSWFEPMIPFNTTYNFDSRSFTSVKVFDIDQLTTFITLNPYDEELIYRWVRAKYGPKDETAEQLEAAYGPLGDYWLDAMYYIGLAYKKNPAKYPLWMERQAEYRPNRYFELGSYYVQLHQDDKAKQAYLNGIEKSPDSVCMSNCCDWLVFYYYDHGQRTKAFELATSAADVYSQGGLSVMARLLERDGKIKEAEEFFIKQKERYETSEPLSAFYFRHRAENPKYKEESDKVMKVTFPTGMIAIQTPKLGLPPKVGARIVDESTVSEAYNLKEGDIFVGVEGYSISNVKQFLFLRNLKVGQPMEFTVWNGEGYRTIKALLPDRRWGCDIVDYK